MNPASSQANSPEEGLQCQPALMAPIMSGIHCTGWTYTFVFILPLFFAHVFENIVYQVRFSA